MAKKGICFDAMKKAMGDKFDEKIANKVLDDLDNLKAVAEASDGLKSFRKLSYEYFKERLIPTKEQLAARLHDLNLTNERLSFYKRWDEKYKRNLGEALISKLTGSNPAIEGGRVSATIAQHSYLRKFENSLLGAMEKDGLLEIAKSGHLDHEIQKERFELGRREGGRPGITGNKEALKIAQILHASDRMQLKAFNEVGVPIKELEGRIGPRTHNPDSLRTDGYEKWSETIYPMIDKAQTFGVQAADVKFHAEFLNQTFNDIILGKNSISEGEDILGDRQFVNRAKTIGSQYKHRKLFFNSAEDEIKYRELYGKGTFWESKFNELRQNAKNVGLISVFGQDPKSAFEADILRVKKIYKDRGDIEGLKGFENNSITQPGEKFARQVYEHVAGYADNPAKSVAGKAVKALSTLEYLQLLGGSFFSNIQDMPALASLHSAATGKNLLQSNFEVVSEFLKLAINPAEKRLIQDYTHMAFHDFPADLLSKVGGEGLNVPGAMSNLQRNVMKATLLPWQQEIFKAVGAKLFMKELGKFSELSFENMTPRVRENIKTYGINEVEWTKLANATEDVNGHRLMTPEAVLKVTGDERLAAKVENYIIDNATFAMDPTKRTKATLLRGTSPDEAMGVALRIMAPLKTFPIHSYHVMSRIAGSDPNLDIIRLGDILKSRQNMSSMKTIAGFAAATTSMAYISNSMKNLTQGKSPEDPTKPMTWFNAFNKGGAGGMISDIAQGLMYASQSRDQSYTEAIGRYAAGPVLGKGADLLRIWKKSQEGRNVKDDLFKFGINQIPGQNNFMIRPTLDYLILNEVHEALNPGYLSNRERYLERDNQRFLIPQANEQAFGR